MKFIEVKGVYYALQHVARLEKKDHKFLNISTLEGKTHTVLFSNEQECDEALAKFIG